MLINIFIRYIVIPAMALLIPAYFYENSGIPEVRAYVRESSGTYENLQYTEYGNHIEITGCDTSITNAVIPAEINGLPVTAIAENAFLECSGLTSVTIPDSIESIGESAFWYCSGLKSVKIPAGVKNIGGDAFFGTPWLESECKKNPLVIVNNILIDGKLCEGNVVIPDGVTKISGYVFSGCTGITSVKIPYSVKNIGNDAFSRCSGIKSIVIPDGVVSIGSDAFSRCSELKSIKIPESVSDIGGNVFEGTPWLESEQKKNPLVVVNNVVVDGTACSGDIVIPDGVTCISINAFSCCSGLTSAVIPESVKTLGEHAFFQCTGLKSVTIPEGVTTIGNSVFSDCPALKKIVVPESVNFIGNGAFWFCSGLTEITILNPECEIYDSADVICNEYDTFKGKIHGYSGSTAQEYAQKYGYNFESMGDAPVYKTGDVNGDGKTDATDATAILVEYALASTEKPTEFNSAQKRAGDIDNDGKIDSTDASRVLEYYSYLSTGGAITDMNKWLESTANL